MTAPAAEATTTVPDDHGGSGESGGSGRNFGSGEFERIARYFAPLAAAAPGALGLKDDAALLAPRPGRRLAVTVDAMVEGVHFLPDDPPELVARKLLRVNLSDLAAMAATPLAYFLTVALPASHDESWIARFAQGLGQDQQAFGITLMGGDSVSTPGPATFTVTALGEVPVGGEVRRSGARPGDLVCVSGTIGDGALGLLAATGRLGGSREDVDFLVGRYRLPQPRTGLGPRLSGLASAMMDVSDGLVADLGHLVAASGVVAVIERDRVPRSSAARTATEADPSLWEVVLTGGDDYELLFTSPPEAASALARLGAQIGVPIATIGRIEAAQSGAVPVRVFDSAGKPLNFRRAGWQHS